MGLGSASRLVCAERAYFTSRGSHKAVQLSECIGQLVLNCYCPHVRVTTRAGSGTGARSFVFWLIIQVDW